MLQAMMRQAGVTEATGEQAREALAEILPVMRALGLEYGNAGCYITPHNPLESPYTERGSLAIDAADELDVQNALGKWATRGHVVNTGDGALYLDWQTPNRQAWHGDYKLSSGAVLDFSSFVVTKLRISAGDAASEYQVLAQ